MIETWLLIASERAVWELDPFYQGVQPDLDKPTEMNTDYVSFFFLNTNFTDKKKYHAHKKLWFSI